MKTNLSKSEYLKIRNMLVRQLSRKKARLKFLKIKKENSKLSESGIELYGMLNGEIATIENVVDSFDLLFEIPYQEELSKIEGE